MGDDLYDQERAFVACNLKCGHSVDAEKTEYKMEWKQGSCGYGYYVFVRCYCEKGHSTDWIEVDVVRPGAYELLISDSPKRSR